MSTRPLIYPVSSIRTLIDAIGTADASLVERSVRAYLAGKTHVNDERVAEVRTAVHSFVFGELENGMEPPRWGIGGHRVAAALGLATDAALNADWEWDVWSDYLDFVRPKLPEAIATRLHYLVYGRPFKAVLDEEAFQYYAWLAQSEAASLHQAITALQEADPTVAEEFADFHDELTNSLEDCELHDLLLVAV
jgi:hypothetical protein